MSVKYSWNRQNGAAMPSVRFMSIEPAEDYYKGMPLKLKEKGIVEPTDGDPEYICMAEYNEDAEIQPLEIPVQEVFPDVVYDRMNEDGTTEEVRFGSKGGGGVSSWNDLTDKPFYKTKKNVFSVENTASEITMMEMYGYNFTEPYPESKSDKFTVTFDGEVYECVAGYENLDGLPVCAFGNLSMMGGGADTGEPFFVMWFGMDVGMGTLGVFGVLTDTTETAHSVSIDSVNIKKLDYEYTYQSDLGVQNPAEIGYVKGNPFFKNTVGQYTFDGNIDGKEVINMTTTQYGDEIKYVKVSDTIPQTMDDNRYDLYTHEKSKYESGMDMDYGDYLLRDIGTRFWYDAPFSYIDIDNVSGYPDFFIVWGDETILGKQFTPGVYMKYTIADGSVAEYTKRIKINRLSYASLIAYQMSHYPTINHVPVDKHIILRSATAGSLKHFEIRIEDDGELTVQEIGKA